MNKPNPLMLVNPLIFILIVIQFITLPLIKFTGWAFASELHEFMGLCFGVALLAHLYFNRVWIIKNIFPAKKST